MRIYLSSNPFPSADNVQRILSHLREIERESGKSRTTSLLLRKQARHNTTSSEEERLRMMRGSNHLLLSLKGNSSHLSLLSESSRGHSIRLCSSLLHLSIGESPPPSLRSVLLVVVSIGGNVVHVEVGRLSDRLKRERFGRPTGSTTGKLRKQTRTETHLLVIIRVHRQTGLACSRVRLCQLSRTTAATTTAE